ncbi:MAG: DUF3899 domain-containing protein [Peptostreptococcaceae bacterium]|jgi:hypothetical protein|nr:DUF3899 domain-containing protein [Peptostreptococcaceae bacterium]
MKKISGYLLAILLASSFFLIFIQKNLLNFINCIFMISIILFVIFGFQFIREGGFFNFAIYSHKKFMKVFRKKSLKDADEDEVTLDRYKSYHKNIKWNDTKYIFISSILGILLSFLLSIKYMI